MNNLLKNFKKNNINNRDNIIKKSILTHLSNSVKFIQYYEIDEKSSIKTNDDINEAINTLCTSIEALFLHGLKDSFTNRFRKAIVDIDQPPQPSFWAPLLIISHRQIIDQINKLTQITSEIGECRAWIRIVLNDCLLSSYLTTIRNDLTSIKSFYRSYAYLRDNELLEVTQRLIEGIETFKSLSIPFNSSLLNNWQLPSLILSGIWSPTLKVCPLTRCDDVVQSIDNYPTNTSELLINDETYSIASTCSGLRQISSFNDENDDLQVLTSTTNECNTNFINEITSKKESTDHHQNDDSSDEGNILKKPKDTEIKNESKSMDVSFNTLLENYNMLLTDNDFKIPDSSVDTSNESKDLLLPTTPSSSSSSSSSESESILFAKQIAIIAIEKGLDNQNYKCGECEIEFKNDNKINVCSYTGKYYCDLCMASELITIPARIIHNWDFKQYPVSQKAFNYLNNIKQNPIIDFKTMNPYIYWMVKEMADLQLLRNQLNFIRAYLYTCKQPIIQELQKKLTPREYLYEHVHQYSISDLSEISNGQLSENLQLMIDFGKEHVKNCWLCNQKGFICEICEKSKVLFPFDIHVYRCKRCNGVYHKSCLNSSKPCPKCVRIKKRQHPPSLIDDVTIE